MISGVEISVRVADNPLGAAALDGAADFFADGQSHAVDVLLFGICLHQRVLFVVGQDIDGNGRCDRPCPFLICLGIQVVFADRAVFHGSTPSDLVSLVVSKICRIIKNPDNLTKSYRRFETPVGSGAEVSSSIGESCSALSAASLENLSAVGSSHSLSEAVFFFSLTLFRLVSSEHLVAPPCSISEAETSRVFTIRQSIL